MKMTEEWQKPTLSFITICNTVQLESKQSTSFWVVPVENSYKETSGKVVLFSCSGCSKQKFTFHFYGAIFEFPAILW